MEVKNIGFGHRMPGSNRGKPEHPRSGSYQMMMRMMMMLVVMIAKTSTKRGRGGR